jgi:hypothetical protein
VSKETWYLSHLLSKDKTEMAKAKQVLQIVAVEDIHCTII